MSRQEEKKFMADYVYPIVVIGAGAAGMTAAISAAEILTAANSEKGENGAKVLLLESNDRVGKKILATGNGKCNFTHAGIGPEHYHTDDQPLLAAVLRAFPTEAALRFFDGLGMLSREKNGYYYPLPETASTVLDVLRLRLSELGCETRCSVRVEDIERADSGFLVAFREQEKLHSVYADSVILATGSRAGGFLQDKKEDPLRIPKALELRSTALYPALAKCICREDYFYRQLAGVRTQAELSLYAECETDGKKGWTLLRQERGELQLTKEGISGIPVFQLSGDIAQKLSEKKQVRVAVNFLPDFSEGELKEWLNKRLDMFSGRTLEEFFLGVLHKKILGVCLQAEGLRGNMRLPEPSPTEKEQDILPARKRALIMVYSVMKKAMHFSTEVSAVADMKQAQVCRGGLLLSQFDEKLECRMVPGLFACGEILNVDGACGGYNLHFAWASGNTAGRAAAVRILSQRLSGGCAADTKLKKEKDHG